MTKSPARNPLELFATWLIIALALGATALLWSPDVHAQLLFFEPVLVVGAGVGVAMWLLAFALAHWRARARDEETQFRAVRARESIVASLADDFTRPKRVSWLNPTSWVFLLLAAGVTGALRFVPNVEHLLSRTDQLLIGGGATTAIWLLACAALSQRSRARQFAIQRRACEGSSTLTRNTLEQMPVMVSTCTTDGRRNDFNSRFIEVFGRDEAALVGLEWMQYVHAQDRKTFNKLFKSTTPPEGGQVVIEYGLTGPSNETRWVRETLIAHTLDDGRLIGYLTTGLDVTNQVENETENKRVVQALKDERDEALTTVERQSDEIASITRERDGLAKDVALEQKNLAKAEKRLESAEKDVANAKSEVRSLKAEKAELDAEKRRLERSLTKLEKELERAQGEASRLSAENDNQFEQIERLKKQTNEFRQIESQLRTKVSDLTTRCEELGEAADRNREALEEAEGAFRERSTEAEGAGRARARAVAESVRPNLASLSRLVSKIEAGAADASQREQIETTRASIESMRAYIDSVLDASGAARSAPDVDVEGRDFDLRDAMRTISALLDGPADDHDVQFKCGVENDFPTSVCGDSVAIREALMLLGTQTLRLAHGGSVTILLSKPGSVSAMVPARFEIRCQDIGIDAEQFRSALGLADNLPDDEDLAAEARNAQWAWGIIDALQGEFGLEVASDDDFTLWFTLHLTRRSQKTRVEPARDEAPLRREPIVDEVMDEEPPARPAADLPLSQAARQAEEQDLATRPAPAPRLPQEGTKCNLGAVLELGQSSARIRTTKEHKGAVKMLITHGAGEQIDIPVEVESSTKVGPRNYDTLVQFIQVTAEQRKLLRRIAMTNRRQITIAKPIEPE